MRSPILVSLGLVWLFVLSSSIAGAQKPEESPSEAPLMEQKLKYAQNILSAIAREDYAGLEQNADQLRKLAEKQWIDRETPEYRAQLKDFWVVLEGVRSSADQKDIDQATIAYMQMTLSCVKCHKHLRKNPQ